MKTVGEFNVPYVLMHILGTPKEMQKSQIQIIVQEVLYYFSESVQMPINNGINDVIIDPGFGFGKTLEHNFELLKNLDLFKALNFSLVGISRKSMIYKKLGISPDDALNGTTVLNTLALLKG